MEKDFSVNDPNQLTNTTGLHFSSADNAFLYTKENRSKNRVAPKNELQLDSSTASKTTSILPPGVCSENHRLVKRTVVYIYLDFESDDLS